MKTLSIAMLASGLMLTQAPLAFSGVPVVTPQMTDGKAHPMTDGKAQPMTDDTLAVRVEHRLETSPLVRQYDIDVEVERGVATLSGTVATAAQKAEAGRLAKVDGVSRVDSTIEVDADVDKTVAKRITDGLSKTGEKINDAWITTKINWFFVGEDLLKDSEINVDTADQVVTLKGFVKSAAGRTRAVELAKATQGVKKVTDQLKVRTTTR